MAVLLAFLMMPMVPAEKALAATDDAVFSGSRYEMTTSAGADGYQLTYTGSSIAFGFKSIVPQGTTDEYVAGDVLDVRNDAADYYVRYFQDTTNDDDGRFNAGDAQVGNGETPPTNVGSYYAVAITKGADSAWAAAQAHTTGSWTAAGLTSADGTLAQGVIAVAFEVVPRDISQAFVYEVNLDNLQDVSDTEYVYNGKAIELGLAIGTDVLKFGQDYTVSINGVRAKAGTNGNGFQLPVDSGATNAGDYTLVITGLNAYFGTEQQIERDVTVAKLNLETAEFFTPDQLAKASFGGGYWWTVTEVDGVNLKDLIGGLTLNQINYIDPVDNADHGVGQPGYKKIDGNNTGLNAPAFTGSYVIRVTPKEGNDNVVGSADYTVRVVGSLVTDAYYGSNELVDYFDGNTFYGSQWTYDPSLITMRDGNGASYTNFTATLTNAAGQVVSAPTTAGKYALTLQVNVPDNYTVGGTVRAEFTYFAGVIDGSTLDVFATIRGENVGMGETWDGFYTGEAVVPSITVRSGSTALTAGADYTVEYADETGALVETMVDAGTYTVTIKLSDQYVYVNGGARNYVFYVEIMPRVLTDMWVVTPAGFDGLPYTGSAIDLTLRGSYWGQAGFNDVTLDPSWYEVYGLMYRAPGSEVWNTADEVLNVGEYWAYVVPTEECENYTWYAEGSENEPAVIVFEVVGYANFEDVASDAWYADEVAQAARLGYVNGVGDTGLYMPLNTITRAEVSQVLFNMAGGQNDAGEQGSYPTVFTDVPASAWFAKPVSWAADAQVVTGYGDTGLFGPYDNATREQIATMLYRYAKAQNIDVSERASLASYADGSQVSDWAAEAMQWAVAEGIFGVGTDQLRPQDDLSRAEMAAVAVRLQPNPVHIPAN